MTAKELINQLSDYLSSLKYPRKDLDTDHSKLIEVCNELLDLGILNLFIPTNLGGLGAKQEDYLEYQVLLSKYSGALLFLFSQHQYAINVLNYFSDNEKVLNVYKEAVDNKASLGLASPKDEGFNLEESDNGYRINGQIRWLSGYSVFQNYLFVIRANEQVYYFIVPGSLFEDCPSTELKTSVVDSIRTVSLKLDNLELSKDYLVTSIASKSAGKPKVVHPGLYNLIGVSKYYLELVEVKVCGDQAQSRFDLLVQEAASLYNQAKQVNYQESLSLRAQALNLAFDCLKFSLIVEKGSFVLDGSEISLLAKEIWLYAVAGLGTEQERGYLEFGFSSSTS